MISSHSNSPIEETIIERLFQTSYPSFYQNSRLTTNRGSPSEPRNSAKSEILADNLIPRSPIINGGPSLMK